MIHDQYEVSFVIKTPIGSIKLILSNFHYTRRKNACFFELLKLFTWLGQQELHFLVPNGSLQHKNKVRDI